MSGYGKWFKKTVEITKRIASQSTITQKRAAIREFLDSRGFQIVEECSGIVTAKRGKWWPIWENDPLAIPHTAEISYDHKQINVHYIVRSWFTLGSEAYTAVFTAELDGLIARLDGGKLDFTALDDAQRNRRKSDRLSYAFIVAFSVCVGLIITHFII